MGRARVRGFTLIEVLVALFVFAVAMVALVQAGTHRADNLGYLRDRTLASWIASDRITAIRLDPAAAAIGTRDGALEMAGRNWFWAAEVAATRDASVRRVSVTVATGADAEALARLTGYVPVPGVRAAPPQASGDRP